MLSWWYSGGRLRRWLWRSALAIFGIAALALGLGRCWLRRSLPELAGTITVDGITHPVRVTRDAHGVPVIEADDEADLFFGLGYVHAQDRFFQMELQRRAGQGRLSELAGPSQVETDTFLRQLGVYRLALGDETQVSPAAQRALAGYAAGVNAWLTAHGGALPPELDLLRLHGARLTAAPWRPADSLVIGKVVALTLSTNFEDELVRADVEDKVGAASDPLLFPGYPLHAPITVGGGEETGATGARAPRPPAERGRPGDPARDTLRRLLGTIGASGRGVGSNGWVIAPSRSASGHAMLANDPHLGIQSPNIFYLAHLKGAGFDTFGVTIPGVPAVMLGRNPRVAWGATILTADTQDLFVEKLDPADPSHYLVRGESRPFETRDETIEVDGAAPVHLTVRTTVHGPVIRDDWKGRGPLALRWTALAPGDRTIDAMLGFDRARDWTEFRAAAANLVGPNLNLLYADVDGHIAYTAAGKVPVRARGDGELPVHGWDGEAEWTGLVPFEDLPHEVDPPRGFIVSANNKSAVAPPFLGNNWDFYRAQRIVEMIAARPKLTFDDMRAMQGDVLSLFARDLVPILITAPADTPLARQALDRLARWDLRETPDSAEGALLTVWYPRLMAALFDDELGAELSLQWGHGRPEALLAVLRDPTGAFCDDVHTPVRESCRDILGRTLRGALDELTTRLGGSITDWRLDRLRIARFENPVASDVPVIGGLFTRRRGLGGDPFTVRVNDFAFGGGYDTKVFQSYLGTFELPGPSRAIVALGQSGHPLSPHFDDLLADWMAARPFAIGEPVTAGDVLTLAPARSSARAER
ncbi:MAG TPA: penicillin acylase family protein [Kofleriaceae bacterium]|nr:penicillin acylase family protein [Kofleriaceae bacterium]